MSDLPALDQPQAHVVVGPNDQRGPYTLELLISEVVAGRLHDATPVWWPGLPDWTTMAAHPGVAAEIARRRAPAPTQATPFAQPYTPEPSYAPEPSTAPEPTTADFEAIDNAPDGFRSSGPAEGLDPQHGEAFAEVVARSRARWDAEAIVAGVDDAIVEAIDAAAISQGLEPVSRDDSGGSHDVGFRADDDTTVVVSVGKVTGHAMAVRDGHVGLDVSCRSTAYVGGPDDGGGEHGSIVVEPGEAGHPAQASVSLLLPMADYVSEDHTVREEALRSDLAAVIASVRHRLR